MLSHGSSKRDCKLEEGTQLYPTVPQNPPSHDTKAEVNFFPQPSAIDKGCYSVSSRGAFKSVVDTCPKWPLVFWTPHSVLKDREAAGI